MDVPAAVVAAARLPLLSEAMRGRLLVGRPPPELCAPPPPPECPPDLLPGTGGPGPRLLGGPRARQ
jgi:hypothetical protein